jgi:hypothetical protein
MPEKAPADNSEKTAAVLRLLADNSRRLQELLSQLEVLQEERVTIGVQLGLLLITFIVVFWTLRFFRDIYVVPLIVTISSLWFYSSTRILRFVFVGRVRAKEVKKEFDLLRPKVEELVRLASQLDEHSVESYGEHVELSFQLDLTEALLRRAAKYK